MLLLCSAISNIIQTVTRDGNYSGQGMITCDKTTSSGILALVGGVSVFSPEYVGHEQDEACRQACDHKLVDGEDVFQRVDPLLHGTGVEVVIDASSNAPQRPHCVQHQRHGEADREAQLPQIRPALSETATEHKTQQY